jgi:hypothetical protein
MPAVGNDPRNGSWERQFEMGLPDCRMSYLERDQHRVYFKHIGQAWDIVYCASCHTAQMATPPDCPHVFFLCDKCFYEKGPPPDCIQVPGT